MPKYNTVPFVFDVLIPNEICSIIFRPSVAWGFGIAIRILWISCWYVYCWIRVNLKSNTINNIVDLLKVFVCSYLLIINEMQSILRSNTFSLLHSMLTANRIQVTIKLHSDRMVSTEDPFQSEYKGQYYVSSPCTLSLPAVVMNWLIMMDLKAYWLYSNEQSAYYISTA